MAVDSLVLFNLVLLIPAITLPGVLSTNTTSTPEPTHIPTSTPHDVCIYDGIHYENGQDIAKETDYMYNCYGAQCQDGSVIFWDSKCFLEPDTCLGNSTKILGECCPICHSTTTPPATTPPTSTHDGCVQDGILYANGEDIGSDPTNCSSAVCSYGVVMTSVVQCAYIRPCNGILTSIPGECCKVCIEVTSNTNTSTETCKDVTCNEVLDCEMKDTYKPYGSCCYTCGSMQIKTSLLLHFFLAVLVTRGIVGTQT